MRLQVVPVWDVPIVWDEVAPLLAKAVAKQTAMSLESLREDCLRGKFWLWHIPGVVAFVTEIQQFPIERIEMIVLCGGENLEAWMEEADATLTRHAKHFGCTALMIVGRQGWARAAPEYKAVATVMRKELRGVETER